MANDEYAEAVGEQVKRLVQTHEILVVSQAEVAARKVRYAIGNYMDTVYARLAREDGGRLAKDEKSDPDQEDMGLGGTKEPDDGS